MADNVIRAHDTKVQGRGTGGRTDQEVERLWVYPREERISMPMRGSMSGADRHYGVQILVPPGKVSSDCPRSGHMGDGCLLGLAGCKVLCGCFSAKGAVGSVSVVAMLEGIDEGVEVLEAGWQVVDGVEFVAP